MVLLFDDDVRVPVRRRRHRLYLPADGPLALCLSVLPQCADLCKTGRVRSAPGHAIAVNGAYHVEIMADEPVPADGAPIARGRERANDAGSREEGEVEAVLRVPSRC